MEFTKEVLKQPKKLITIDVLPTEIMENTNTELLGKVITRGEKFIQYQHGRKYDKEWWLKLDLNCTEDQSKYCQLLLNNTTTFIEDTASICLHVHNVLESLISVTFQIESCGDYLKTIRTIGLLKQELPPIPVLIHFVKNALYVSNNADVWSVICHASREYGVNLNSDVWVWVKKPFPEVGWDIKPSNNYNLLDRFVEDVSKCHDLWSEGKIKYSNNVKNVESPILTALERSRESWEVQKRLIENRMHEISLYKIDKYNTSSVFEETSRMRRFQILESSWKGMAYFLKNQG